MLTLNRCKTKKIINARYMMISLTSCENLVKWNIKITTSVQIATNPGLFKPEQISFALIRTDYVCSLSSGFAYWKLMYSFSLDLNYVKSLKIWLQKSTEGSKKHNKTHLNRERRNLCFDSLSLIIKRQAFFQF